MLDARADAMDLRVRLKQSPRATSRTVQTLVASIAITLSALLATPGLQASEVDAPVAHDDRKESEASQVQTSPAATISPESIDDVLARPEFRWRLPQQQQEEEDPPGWLQRFKEWLAAQRRLLEDWSQRLRDWLEPDAVPGNPSSGILTGIQMTELAIYAAIALLAVLVAWLIFRSILKRAPAASQVSTAPAAGPRAAAAELDRADTHASDRPSDEWAALATEMAARGEWRLALRAWHLYSLSRLGESGHLRLNRAKSDRDYEVELRRRAQIDLLARFAAQRVLFESRWYGREPTDPTVVERFAKPWDLA
jgi:hypothetical protein